MKKHYKLPAYAGPYLAEPVVKVVIHINLSTNTNSYTIKLLSFILLTLITAQTPCLSESKTNELFIPGVKEIGPYSITAKYVYAKNDVSAVARINSKHGVIGVDEGVFVQLCEISDEDKSITITDSIRSLIPLLTDASTEIDVEGITAIANTYYVTGSHGLAKKTGFYQKTRHLCFRFDADPKTGRQISPPEQSSLRDIFSNDPVLKPFYKATLQQRGVNIEGLAARNGKLYFGLRSPNLKGSAHVIEIAPDELFSKKTKKSYTLKTVELRTALGIRDIAAVQDGFLIIAGNSGSAPGKEVNTKIAADFDSDRPYYLFFWDGDDKSQYLGEIQRDNKDHKLEALLIIQETDRIIKFLTLADSAPAGNPVAWQIRKTK